MTPLADRSLVEQGAEGGEETFVPHLGWLVHEAGEDVARSLREGWFEYREQAFFWLYLRPGSTVLDCGAHVGLFSVLAGRLIGGDGRLLCVEPNPSTVEFLEHNLAAHGLPDARVVRAAVGDRESTAKLNLGGSGRAAYSSLLSIEGRGDAVDVPVVTLDQLADAENIEGPIDLLKLDVEGFEIEALAGARGLLTSGRIQVLLVEFTERNLNAGGRSTIDLCDAIASAGYALHRFDDADLTLHPVEVTAPVDYDNFFALRGSAGPTNALLAAAAPDRRRHAHDIIKRGGAANELRLARAALRQQMVQFNAEHRSRIEQLKAQIQTHKATIRNLQARLRSVEANFGDVAAELANARAEHRRVVRSLTWRCTRPLRALGGLVTPRRRWP